ncbi:MAG: hypothetical protein K0R57_6152 [Paenibacillaceae bacterium]|jgi:hypothetical protein|nr:hypothetical protein [Paenibacillaceae bacterium]
MDGLKQGELLLGTSVPDGLVKVGRVAPKAASQIRESRIGIGLEKLDRSLYDPEKVYGQLAALGVKWVRIQSGWAKTEKERGIYSFEWLDAIVDSLLDRHMVPWMCLCYGNELYDDRANNKTGAIGCPPIHSEEAKAAWSRYVSACVSRYKGRVEYFEVWNEPDGTHCWRHGVNAREYGRFAADTARAVKSANPGAKVLGGSFCGTELQFLHQALQEGLGEDLDYVTYHNYKFDIEAGVLEFVRTMRAIIDQFNPRIGIIQGETGAPSAFGRGALKSSGWTYDRQAKFLLRRMMIDLMCEVKFASYFTLVDMYENLGGSEPTIEMTKEFYGYFGVLEERFDGDTPLGEYAPKPSYYAFQHLCSLFPGEMRPVDLPLSMEALPSRAVGGYDVRPDDPKLVHTGFRKENGSAAFVYWYAADIMKECYSSTISFHYMGECGDIRLVDLYSGNIYELDGSILEQPYRGAFRLKHLPLRDYPLVITFGDFIS